MWIVGEDFLLRQASAKAKALLVLASRSDVSLIVSSARMDKC